MNGQGTLLDSGSYPVYCSIPTHPFSSVLSDATKVEKLESAFVSLFCKRDSECGLDSDS